MDSPSSRRRCLKHGRTRAFFRRKRAEILRMKSNRIKQFSNKIINLYNKPIKTTGSMVGKMNHILDLYNANPNGEDLKKLNEYLEWNDRQPFILEEFKKLIETNKDVKDFGSDTVGFIYDHPQITGFNAENVGCKHLCDNSDSEIMEEMGINDESTEEEWENYYEATTTARSEILDTVADYAVLIEKNEKERIFVMLNSWHDPLFTKAYPLDRPIYDVVW